MTSLFPELPDLQAEGADRARHQFRAACRRSLYFFTKSVVCSLIDPNLMTDYAFKESCEWLQHVLEFDKRCLFEDPRNHAKSTRTTVAIPLWIAIQRPDENLDHPNEFDRASKYLEVHSNIRGPDTRIAIASERDTKAMEWVTASRRHWERNDALRWAFPELLWGNPKASGFPWSGEAYTLPGRLNPTLPDPFLRAIGIKSGISGGRVDLLLIDDIVSEPSAESATELRYRTNWVHSAGQLIEVRKREPDGSVIMLVTNRWNFNDPNSMIHDQRPDWAIWRRAYWKCGVHGFGNCGRLPSDTEHMECTATETMLWPERHGEDVDALWRDLGDYIAATQWANQPQRKSDLDVGKLMDFDLQIRVVNTDDGHPYRSWCVIIPEVIDNETGEPITAAESIPIGHLTEHMISIDPAGADEESEARKAGKTARWAISWFAMDPPTGRVFWLDCRAGHWPPDIALQEAFDCWYDSSEKLGAPIGLMCEKVATQTVVASALRFLARSLPDPIELPEIEMIPPARGLNKDNKIRLRFGMRLGQRRIYLRRGLILPRVETRQFPTGHKDCIDTEVQYEERVLEKQGPTAKSDATMKRMSRRRQLMIQQAGITGV
ncbi:MAG: hypothetical protein V3S43_06270 [Acidimicrobiia bacterium]